MSDQVKNRLVGAIVLFALAIIFLPKIFDGEKESQRREFVAIPQKPQHQVPDLSKLPQQQVNEAVVKEATSEGVTQSTSINVESIPDKSKPVEPKAKPQVAKPAPKANKPVTTKAQAWVIRMGSFGNPSNVKTLVKKLRAKGFTAFSVPSTPKQGVSNRVYVGPELNKKALQAMQPKLKKGFNESGVIEKYNPIN